VDQRLPAKLFQARVVEALGGEAAEAAFRAARREKGLDGAEFLGAPIIGYDARGYLGQSLMVLPASRMIVVRLRRETNGERSDERAQMPGLAALVARLTRTDAR